MQSIIGWDIGGAHLKAARLENNRIVKVVQIACPLWLGLDELHRSFAEAKEALGPADRNVATMTAELCDAFLNRTEGVLNVATIASRELAPVSLKFYAGASGFIEPEAVNAEIRAVASANWHASATLVGRHFPEALFIDMGSTTTDIVPVKSGMVATCGYTDAERMRHGELVYAGIVRSLLVSGLRLVPFEGRWIPLMNEMFATTSDIYRLLGELPDGADVMPTADGRDKSIEASRTRLARQIGHDTSDASPQAFAHLARFFAETQVREVADGAHLVLSQVDLPRQAPIVGAGVGRFVVKRLAHRLERPYVDFSDLVEVVPEVRVKAGDCAPASALALLAAA
jgi:(4-(4-[2-(gamma-L-glutamylamino)ethyl]phenoxymethyl)furan-2-yl)methanamine synthase